MSADMSLEDTDQQDACDVPDGGRQLGERSNQ